jgi:hypothetical protein
MSDSATMLEIRKIKEENSLRYLNMTSEEMDKEFDESVKWFIERLGKDVKIVSKVTWPVHP